MTPGVVALYSNVPPCPKSDEWNVAPLCAVTLWLIMSRFVHLIVLPTFTVMFAGLMAMFWYLTWTRPLCAGPLEAAGAAGAAALLLAVLELDELLEPQPANTSALPTSSTGRTLFMAG